MLIKCDYRMQHADLFCIDKSEAIERIGTEFYSCLMASNDKRLHVNGYDELKNTVKQFGKEKRIFVLFYASKDSQGNSWYEKCSPVY